jgi:hypothetical protein
VYAFPDRDRFVPNEIPFRRLSDIAEVAGAVPIVWLDSFIKFSIEGITGRGDIMPSNLF